MREINCLHNTFIKNIKFFFNVKLNRMIYASKLLLVFTIRIKLQKKF